MADLSGNRLILLWPLVTTLTWVVIARGRAHLPAYRLSTTRWHESWRVTCRSS
jgi:hypothetical protein